jgi:hypothetical protein
MNLDGIIVSGCLAGVCSGHDGLTYIVARKEHEFMVWVVPFPPDILPINGKGLKVLPRNFDENEIFSRSYERTHLGENLATLKSDLNQLFGITSTHIWYPIDRNPLQEKEKNTQ